MSQSLAVRAPAQKRSAETMNRLLLAAEETFSERGFAASRLVDIAAKAGVTVGAVYARFRDKEALFNAVLRRFHHGSVAEVQAYFEAAISAGVSAYDGVRRFVIGTGLTFAARQGIYRAIIERGLTEPDVWLVPTEMRADVLGIIMRFLAHKGHTATMDSHAAMVAQQMMYGSFLISLLNPRSPMRADDRAALGVLAEAVCFQFNLSPTSRYSPHMEFANGQL